MQYSLSLGVLVFALCGCSGGASGPASGSPPAGTASSSVPSATASSSTGAAIVTVRELMDHSQQYADRPVILSGKVILECSQGCWLFLNDGTGQLYVDLAPNGLTIPQMVGSQIKIQGRIRGSGSNLQILGETVEFPK